MADNGLNIDELQIKIGVNASQASSGIKSLAKDLSTLTSTSKGSQSALEKTAQTVVALGTETSKNGKDVVAFGEKSSNAFSRIAEIAVKAAPAIKKVGLTTAKYIGKVAITPFVNFGKGVAASISRLSGFLGAIKRIATYRLIRSAIKMITQGISEGVKTLIEWDKAFGNNTSGALKTANEIKAKWGEVQKSFGAAAMPLIQILQPALMAVMNTVINVANAINQVLRNFQGFSTYMKATTKAIGNAASAGKKAANDLKRVLFGFDDLNVLPSDKGSGTGSDTGNASAIDFVETPIESLFKIDTSGKTLGAQIAELINNAVERFDAIDFGKKIADKINIGIANVKDFFTLTNFERIGNRIGELISSAIRNTKWGDLGTAIGAKLLVLPKLIVGAIETLDFKGIGQAISSLVVKAANTIEDWLNDTDWEAFGRKLIKGLSDFISGLNVQDFISAIWKLLKAIVKAAWEILQGILNPYKDEGIQEQSGDWSTTNWGNPFSVDDINTNRKSVNKVFGTDLKPVEVPIKLEELTPKVQDEIKATQLAFTTGKLSPIQYATKVAQIAAKAQQEQKNTQAKISKGEIAPLDYRTSVQGILEKANLERQKAQQDLNAGKISPLQYKTTVANIDAAAKQAVKNAQAKLPPISAPIKVGTNKLGTGLGSALSTLQNNLSKNPLSVALSVAGKISGAVGGSIFTTAFKAAQATINKIKWYAGGGVPDTGTLFYAGESGAEIVASSRSGQTGVMNMQQMQEAVAMGNIEVVNALYAVANMLGREIRSKDNNVYLDGDKIGQSVSRYQNNQARRGMTVKGAY